MPYIKPEGRSYIDGHIFPLGGLINSPGELNYAITELVHDYIKHKKLCYSTVNEAAGVLNCVQAELYRTVIGPYEQKKMRENGPISDLDDDSHERMR